RFKSISVTVHRTRIFSISLSSIFYVTLSLTFTRNKDTMSIDRRYLICRTKKLDRLQQDLTLLKTSVRLK
ncbi:hypothetical protein ALC60_10722, partial [Trachymyrmex zeteki]